MSVATLTAPPVTITDGGRAAAGFPATKHDPGDCVARALSVALYFATDGVEAFDYRGAYDLLAQANASKGGRKSARDGIPAKVYRPVFDERAKWTPTMTIGSGVTMHCAIEELPYRGVFILRLSRHLSALIDGVIYDNHDPSRGGSRAVYGYWRFA